MARELKEWERNNIFRSRLAEDVFQLDILDKIHRDYEAHMKDKGMEFDREDLESKIVEVLEDVINGTDFYLDDVLDSDEMEDEDNE